MMTIEKMLEKFEKHDDPELMELMMSVPIPDEKVVEWGAEAMTKLMVIPDHIKENTKKQMKEILPLFKEAYEEENLDKLSMVTALYCKMTCENIEEMGVEVPECVIDHITKLFSWNIAVWKKIGLSVDDLNDIEAMLVA